MRAVLWPNVNRDIALTVTQEVTKILHDLGVTVVVPLTLLGTHDIDAIKMPMDDVFTGANFVVSLGGDGTMLHCAAKAVPEGVPILGINLGHLGFMTELERHELHFLQQVVDNQFFIDNRMMLDVTVQDGTKILHSDIALNDAVISGDVTARVLELKICADDAVLTQILGDGVVISTPTGSTAYAMSAGGPIMEPACDSIAITPICPHGLWARAFLLSSRRDVRIEPLFKGGHNVFLTVDGREAVPVKPTQSVCIRRSELVCRFIRLKERNFYQIIAAKMGGCIT